MWSGYRSALAHRRHLIRAVAHRLEHFIGVLAHARGRALDRRSVVSEFECGDWYCHLTHTGNIFVTVQQPAMLELRILQRLVQVMGRREEATAEDWESLALEWVGVGPVSPAIYEPLLARFRRCRKA